MSVHRNTLLLFGSEVVTTGLLTAAGLLMARALSLPDFGRFIAATSFVQIALLLADPGTGPFIAKEVAKGSDGRPSAAADVLLWRLILVLLLGLAAVSWRGLIPLSEESRKTALLLAPPIFLIMVTDYFCWILKGVQNMRAASVVRITSRGLLLLLCAGAFLVRDRLPYLIAAHWVAGGVSFLAGLSAVHRCYRPLRFRWLGREFFTRALPALYASGGVFVVCSVYARIDIVLTERLCGEVQAGFLGCASRVLDGLRLLPLSAFGAMIPAIAPLRRDAPGLKESFFSVYDSLCFAAAAVALLAAVFSDALFPFVFGAPYSQASSFFKPLAWSCVLMFENQLISAYLFSTSGVGVLWRAIAAGLGLNVFLNLLLLPRFGAQSAVWTKLAAELLIFVIHAWGLSKRTGWSLLEIAAKPVGACAAGTLLTLFAPWESRITAVCSLSAVLLLSAGAVARWKDPVLERKALP